jgi:hypothetical protein
MVFRAKQRKIYNTGIVLNVVNKTGEYSWFDGKMETHDALKKWGNY